MERVHLINVAETRKDNSKKFKDFEKRFPIKRNMFKVL